MSIRSMTGFARIRETISGTDVDVSIKSVNHRGLDIHFYSGPELDGVENAMRAAVKRHVGRGHLDIRIHLSRSGVSGSLAFDSDKLAAWIAAYRQAAKEYSLTAPPDLNAAFRVPGIITDNSGIEVADDFGPALVSLLERALGLLNEFREREGAELREVLLDRAANLQRTADEIEACRTRALPAYHARLRDRLSDLLASSSIDPQRLVQEAALLADRSDIGEEVERLRIHAGQVQSLLRIGDEVGKKLDFLLQEMNRETNTILSKTSGLGDHGLKITELAVGAKSDIEKMREQALNLE